MSRRRSDTDQGWIKREFAALKKQMAKDRAAKKLEAATIGKGGLTVKLGGRIAALYPSGAAAAYWGRLFRDINGDTVYGIGTLDRQGSSVFTAYCYDTPGDRGVVDGDAEYVNFEGYSQVYLNSGADNRIEITPTNIWIQHNNPVGNPNLIGVDDSGIVLQALVGTIRVPGMTSTSNAANLNVDLVTGAVKRSTSSLRYKQDLEDATVDPADVLQLRARTWRDRAEVETDAGTTVRHTGFIAEELHELASMRQFLVYDADDQPEAIAYDRLTVALVALAQQQQTRLDDLDNRLKALEENR